MQYIWQCIVLQDAEILHCTDITVKFLLPGDPMHLNVPCCGNLEGVKYRRLLLNGVSVVQSLINSRPEATTALLMQLCTDMGDPTEADSGWVAKIGDFAHLYTDRHAPRLSKIKSTLPEHHDLNDITMQCYPQCTMYCGCSICVA